MSSSHVPFTPHVVLSSKSSISSSAPTPLSLPSSKTQPLLSQSPLPVTISVTSSLPPMPKIHLLLCRRHLVYHLRLLLYCYCYLQRCSHCDLCLLLWCLYMLLCHRLLCRRSYLLLHHKKYDALPPTVPPLSFVLPPSAGPTASSNIARDVSSATGITSLPVLSLPAVVV